MSGDLSPIMRRNIFRADGVGIGLLDLSGTTERNHIKLTTE
jgi:hypothetical protein